MGKKLALLLFGISYREHFHQWSKRNVKIDYKKSLENYKTFIFEYFEKLGYKIDVFFATNEIDNDEKEKLLEIYKPVDCIFLEHANEKRTGRNEKFRNVIDLCVKHKDNNYDHVLITRFDLLFQKNFQESVQYFVRISKTALIFLFDNNYFEVSQ